MIASKVMCDDTYSNKSWSIVAQSIFTLSEINQMEREMCVYLRWKLNVGGKTLKAFESTVRNDFNCPGPYPTYVLSALSKLVGPSEATQQFVSSTSPIPSFTFGPPPKSIQHQPHPPLSLLSRQGYTPDTPDSPSLSVSTTSSPASSAPPTMPIGIEDPTIHISSTETSQPNFTVTVEKVAVATHSLKEKMFAHAVPTAW